MTTVLAAGVMLAGVILGGSGASASSERGADSQTQGGWPYQSASVNTANLGLSSTAAGRGDRRGVSTGISHVHAAVDALEVGRLADADRSLRTAMADPSTRETARRMLIRLHKDTRFKLPAREEGVAEIENRTDRSLDRFESASFVLLSDAGPENARETLALLERTRHEMFRFTERLGMPAVPHADKLNAVVFADHHAFRAFAASDGLMAQWAGGYYTSEANRIVLFSETSSPAYIDASRELSEHAARADEHRRDAMRARAEGRHELAGLLMSQAESLDVQLRDARQQLRDYASEAKVSKAVHEAAHLLAFNIGLQRADRVWPFWLSEGLATAFETDHARQAFGPGIASESREAELRDLINTNKTMPYSRLVALVTAPDEDVATAGQMYAQSYGLFTYLAKYQRDALAQFISEINNTELDPANVSETRRVFLALFEHHFGPPSALQRRIERNDRASHTGR